MSCVPPSLQGPWKLCFKVHRGGTYRPPSLMVELSYFTVNHRSLVRPRVVKCASSTTLDEAGL